MTTRTRKLIGSVVLVLFLGVYVLVAGVIGSGRITQASVAVQVLYFGIAGLLWVLPAGLLIRWMSRPD
jgi:hypothetical protein